MRNFRFANVILANSVAVSQFSSRLLMSLYLVIKAPFWPKASAFWTCPIAANRLTDWQLGWPDWETRLCEVHSIASDLERSLVTAMKKGVVA